MAEREELILEVRAELAQAQADVERLQSQLEEIEGKAVEVGLAVDDQATPIVEGVAADVEALDGAMALTSLAVDDQASDTIAEVVEGIEELDGSTSTATIEVDDEVTDAAEEALSALEDIEGTFTATIETEGADAASEAVGGIAEGLGEISGGQGLAALSAAGFLAIGANAADATLDVQGLALATGATLEQASRLKEAWEQAGGSMDTLERNAIRANAQIRESPELANALGIQINENTSAYDVFVGAVNALNSGQLTATERLDLAMDVFGSRGVLILNDLQTRVGDLDAFMAQVGDNEIITQEQVDQAVAFEQSWDAVTDAMAAIGREILPSVAASAERIGAVLESWPIENLIGGFEVMGAQISLIEAALGSDGGNVADTLSEITEALETLLGLGRDEITFPVIEAWRELKADLADNGEIDTATDALALLAEASGKSEDEVLGLAGALEVVAPAAENVVSSIGDINQALQNFDDQQTHTRELWDVVMADFADNQQIDTSSEAWNRLKEILVLTDEQMSVIANQKLDDQLADEEKAADAAAEAHRKHAEAIRETVAAFDAYLAGFDPVASRLAGVSAAFDTLNERSQLNATQETLDFVDSLNALSGAIDDLEDSDLEGLDLVPDTWGEVLNMPEELGPVVDAIVSFRENVQSEMSQAFTRGGAAEARQWAQDTRQAVIDALPADLAQEQVDAILTSLGLLDDEQIDVTIRIAEAEQARQVLNDISGLLEDLPPSVQREVALEVIAGDPVAALAIVQAELDANPTTVSVTPVLDPNEKVLADPATKLTITAEADTEDAESDIGDVVDAEYVSTITVEADTVPADQEIDLVAAEARTADIDVNALLGGFESEMLFATRDRTTTVDVATGTIDLPSAAELRNRIGTVRVPIQAFWNTRIEGNRPI